jgi:hypothetical protein
LLGTDHAVVVGNLITGNHPREKTPFAGGIVMASATSVGGHPSSENVVRANQLRSNRPAEIVYDGSGGGNRFIRNHCVSATPKSLCP